MTLSRPARLMAGITLLTVPTILYGGLTILAVLTSNRHGLAPGAGLELTPLQQSLFRAGHAHAGALVILSLVVQVLLDSARLSEAWRWTARIAAPTGGVLVSGGFFGLAFLPGFAALLWAGALCLALTMVVAGVGLVRTPSVARVASSTGLASAAALLLSVSTATASETGRLEVTVGQVSSEPGRVGCALFASKKGFPMEPKEHALARQWAVTKGGATTCTFEGLAPGEYAVAVFHDSNGNEEADTNFLGIPTEGVGVSNNALPKMSSPSFDACRFTVVAGETAKQAINLRY
jgi:uncharacterized protein (DUF2141 family)